MKVFVRVIDEGGFAKAARALDMAPPVVTRMVAELEGHLDTRLVNRTTRRISLTEAGESYLERARQILADIDEADARASQATSEPRGPVRLLTAPAIAVHQLAKHLPKFHARYPQVSLLIDTPGFVTTIDEDYDITVLTTREALRGDFVARRLARSEVVLCAAPEYLDRRGRPQHPRELAGHDSLIPAISSLQRGVTFYRGGDDEPGRETYTIESVGTAVLRTSHNDTNYAAALHGLGIAGLPSMMIEDALTERALERVLPGWRLFSVAIWAAVPSRKHMPARTRVLLDFLVEVFGGEDRDPWLAAAGCES